MSLRLSLVSAVLVLLTGCVSVGSTDVLFTPIGVVALHSFKPPERPQVAAAALPQPASTSPADTGSLVVANAACTDSARVTAGPCGSRSTSP